MRPFLICNDMSQKRYVTLAVDADKYDALITALLQKNYIAVANVHSVKARQELPACPACNRDFSKVSNKTVDENLLWDLLRMIQGMRTAHAVVVYEGKVEEVRPIDRPRAVKFSAKSLKLAETLKLVTKFMDGDCATYYISEKCIKFINGDEELNPAYIAISEGRILDVKGSLHIDQVKSKEGSMIALLHDLRDAIKNLPIGTKNFINSGQIPLM